MTTNGRKSQPDERWGSIGPSTYAVFETLLRTKGVSDSALSDLGDALAGWDDSKAVEVVTAVVRILATERPLELSDVARWVRAHANEPAAVADCMSIVPPEEISLTRVLSRAGSQKLVFLATWRLQQRQVVLKKLTGPKEVAEKILAREALSHPLSLEHPNIIETHSLRNRDGEVFLVEACLPHILSDDWRTEGTHEAANLLFDLGKALTFLHTDRDLVHGDVKPDNIGQRGDRYILLDFGICRKSADFSPEVTPTGSLRTRAPELFGVVEWAEPHKVDVWALAATVYNGIVGRFPLFEPNESPPRISSPLERGVFEERLRHRIENEWERRVDLSSITGRLRPILEAALEKDPAKRSSSSDLIDACSSQLSSFVRSDLDEIGRFSPLEEIDQLVKYMPSGLALELMPNTQRQALRERLRELRAVENLEEEKQDRLDELLASVSL